MEPLGLDLPELRARHLEHLKRYDGLDPSARLAAAEDMRRAAVEAGRWIEGPADRDAAQGILDYWTAAISSLPNQKFPELVRLEPFDPSGAALVEERAETTFAGLSEAAQAAAARLFAPPQSQPAASDRISSVADLDEALAAFEKAGLIRQGNGEGRTIVHESLLRAHWPQLKEWLADRDRDEATLRGFVAAAEKWDHAKRQGSYLLRGRKLKEARDYKGRAALLDKLIVASDAAQTHRWVAACVVLAAIVGVYAASVGVLQVQNASLKRRGDVLFQSGAEAAATQNVQDIRANLIEPAELPPAPPAADRSSDPLSAPKGAIWIGSAAAPLLTQSGQRGQPIAPSDVRPGGLYLLRVDIALRRDLPGANYTLSPATGALDAGSTVVALDRPRAYQRLSGQQYWMHVRQALKVYVQFVGSDERVDALESRLQAAGYVTPPKEERPQARRKLEVRYYRDADRPFAEALTRTLSSVLRGKVPPKCTLFTDSAVKAPPGVLEAWVDLEALRVADKPRPPDPRSGPFCG